MSGMVKRRGGGDWLIHAGLIFGIAIIAFSIYLHP